MKKLETILTGLDPTKVIGKMDLVIRNISSNSKNINTKYLFVAIEGNRLDGHKFIDNAVEQGASTVVCEKLPDSLVKNITYIKVKSSRKSYAKICCNFFGNPSKELKLIGVTGTNGKTTTVSLAHDLMLKMGYKSGLISTNTIKINNKNYKTDLTTPDSYYTNFYLRKMVDLDVNFCFMEVSSHSIHQDRINSLEFFLCVFTNITHDHLNYHGDFKSYLNTKKRLFDNLKNNQKSLVNIDDKNGMYMTQNTGSKIYTMSLKKPADFKLRVLENSLDGMKLKIDNVEIQTSLIGTFNAYNILSVTSIARVLNLNEKNIYENLSLLKSPTGRFEIVAHKKITAIIDYAHTPDALLNILNTIHSININNLKVITVIGCGGGRDKDKRKKMGLIAVNNSSFSVFTSDNPRDEDPEKIIEDMISGIEKIQLKKVMIELDREIAIKLALSMLNEKCIILIAGKGHEKYQIIKSKKIEFNDLYVVKKSLKIAV